MDTHIITEQLKHPTILHLASKLALSKMALKSLSSQIFSSFVVAMYKEHKRFSFDMELLLLTALHYGSSGNVVGKAPIVWIESNEESNFYTTQVGKTDE